MIYRPDEDEDNLFDPDLELDEEEIPELPPPPLPSLAQMEKDCDWASEQIDRRLAEDPDYPTDLLLAEIRQRVRPLTGYRPTDSEWAGLGILAMRAKVADRVRELEKEEEEKEDD